MWSSTTTFTSYRGRSVRSSWGTRTESNTSRFFSTFPRLQSSLFEYGHIEDEDTHQVTDLKKDLGDPDALAVQRVDLNIADNTKVHHTSEYDITDPAEVAEPRLVVRRGQPFDISIVFNRPYNRERDELKLVFQAGENPVVSKGTHVELILSDKDEPRQWGAMIKSQNDKTLNVTVFTPPTCHVAKWKFKLDVLLQKDQEKAIFRYNHKDVIYILFNPWCKDDAVYMEGEAEKEEYVLNETGEIYSGFYYDIDLKPWTYGQFQGNVLDCCMHILDESKLKWPARGNPVPVVRTITAVVNSENNHGILTGNWSGNYAGGKSPLSWTGSVTILEEYYRTKSPVLYGQCWVFSGVTTTVCRALGIPARSVTNFESAHDNDGSITIDTYHYFEPVSAALEDEKKWNFHVWNEMWMSRPDLPLGYGGWQACDATPQEASDAGYQPETNRRLTHAVDTYWIPAVHLSMGVYRCGPAPVAAIKRGEVHLPYDCQFVFAEVNADTVDWYVHGDGRMQRGFVGKRGIGKNISTASLEGRAREDITESYKFPEGSDEERVAVLKANQSSSTQQEVYDTGKKDVQFELRKGENKLVGDNFDVFLNLTNGGEESRTVKGRLSCKTMYYTGVTADTVALREFDVILRPGDSVEEILGITVDDYRNRLQDMCMMQAAVMARVVETEQIFTKLIDFKLKKPKLDIKAPLECNVGSEMSATITFTNPLGETLTGCTVEVDGPGLLKPKNIQCGDVKAKEAFTTTVNFTPRKVGKRQIVVMFSSDQLADISGRHTVNVRAA